MFNVSINVQCLNAKSLGFSAWNALSNPSSPLLFNSSIQTNQPWSVIASITEGKELFIPFNYADDKHRGWRYHHLAKSSFYKAFSLYIKYIHIYTVYTFVVYDRIWEGCGENWRIDGAVVYSVLPFFLIFKVTCVAYLNLLGITLFLIIYILNFYLKN